jgi:hypothetical protein
VSQRSRRIAGRSIHSTKRACESMKMEKTPMEIQSIKSYLRPNQRRFHIHMERHPLRFSPAYFELFSYENGPNDTLLSELKKSIVYNRTERRVVSTLSSLESGPLERGIGKVTHGLSETHPLKLKPPARELHMIARKYILVLFK